DIVINALKRTPDVPVTLNVHGIMQPGSERYAAQLKSEAGPQVHFHEALAPDAVSDAMADCDFVVVPSRCLETGPLVVYEAFGTGTPVLGAHFGGIAELVT